jgi:hypothetical protein
MPVGMALSSFHGFLIDLCTDIWTLIDSPVDCVQGKPGRRRYAAQNDY